MPEQDALVAMARAHVLLAGTSAVSRLAAVYGHELIYDRPDQISYSVIMVCFTFHPFIRLFILLTCLGGRARCQVLSRGVVLAPGGVPMRPLKGLRAVISVYDHRFWDRSESADSEFWEGRSDIVSFR